MGISNLLPALDSITVKQPLSHYRGKRAAVDMMCWLHRGSIRCAREIYLYNDSSKLVDYCVSRLEELINNGITPYVVFDGADLPNKQITDDSRKLRRDEALSRAQELEQNGNVGEARGEYYRALEITPELYVPLIKRLALMGIQYIVAPYEADAELGYLYRNNFVDFVITEDGDSLVYGCRCVLFKLDNGIGDEIDVSRLNECESMDFCGWTHDMFTYMCILSGCDYLPNLYGVGIKTAYTLVNLAKRPDAIFDLLRQKTSVPDSYVTGFMRAVFTFRHQTVIDPRTLATVPLMPYTSAVAAMDKTFLGPLLPSDVAARVATGQVHPTTHQPMLAASAEVMEEEGSEQRSLVEETPAAATETPGGQFASSVRFSSPFISVSFRALIEKPSERGLATESDLSQLDSRIKRMAMTPVKSSVGSSMESMGSMGSAMGSAMGPAMGPAMEPAMEPAVGSTATLTATSTTPSTTPSVTAPKREYRSMDEERSVVAESPPRKRVARNRVEESPVINRNSFLDRFRNTVVGHSAVCCKHGVKE